MFDFSVLRLLRKQKNLTIGEVSQRSGISHAFLSKLERNLGNPELATLSKLAAALGLSSAELIKIAELKTGAVQKAVTDESAPFIFRKISFQSIRLIFGEAKKGASISRPEVHENDYEYLYVLRGQVSLVLPGEAYVLNAGESMQFDAILRHSYEALQDSEIFIVHQRKDFRI